MLILLMVTCSYRVSWESIHWFKSYLVGIHTHGYDDIVTLQSNGKGMCKVVPVLN